MKLHIRVFIQIFLLVSMSCAFSYLIHQTDNLVSAQDNSGIVNTCMSEGKMCQEYLANECENQCGEACIAATRNNVAGCELGGCFDPLEGTCLGGSPKDACESEGGKWGNNLIECELGCCIIGSQVSFITNRQCDRIKELLGISTDFKPEIDNALECMLEKDTQGKGACVVYSGEDKICRFVAQSECSGEFYENFLCSNPQLEMGYEKVFTTNCADGKDEVYWFDDHGNRENIYEGANSLQKDSSWNNGLVKLKNDSCDLTDVTFGTCGNCDVFTNSRKCGEATADEKLEIGNVVCRDISCEWQGETYENGESWCYYQGEILPKPGSIGFNRSVAVPGSRHFRMMCHEGIVYNYSCGDERNEICREILIEVEGGNFSVGQCIDNLASLCLNYNTWEDRAEAMDKCEQNVDCYIKQVRVPRSKFVFNACVPKYPIGFDFTSANPLENGDAVCSLASLTCQATKIKKASGAWKWVNKGCLEAGFAQQMNDFCMSLGDCGASVNYIGEYSDSGYSVFGSPPLIKAYIDSINYSKTIQGEYIETLDIEDYLDSLIVDPEGGGIVIGNVNFPEDVTKSDKWKNLEVGLLSIAGLAPPSLLLKAKTGPILGKVGTPIFGAVVGAVIGAGVTMYLIKVFKLGPGISNDLAQALITSAAIGGGILGTAIATSAYLGGIIPVFGWIFLGAAILTTIFLRTANVGKTKTYTVSFQCMPWQPPMGGESCNKCYEDGFGCSKYACEALGTACEFLNEGTSFEGCYEVENDMSPPVIKPWKEGISEGFEYEEFENGFKLFSAEGGCISASSLVKIGIQLNKRGRCTITMKSGIFDAEEIIEGLEEGEYSPEDFGLDNDFLTSVGDEESLQDDETGFNIDTGMDEFYFGGNNRFLINHSHSLYVPSLSSLGIGGFGPDIQEDFDLKIRCEDVHGNPNPKDYVIRMCLKPEEDLTAPYILDKDPIDGLVKNNATDVNFSVYTNEPADCKWDLQDKDYELMENDFVCMNNPQTDLKIRAGGSFKCESNTEMTSDELNLYARCRDQPWLSPENESDRHTMNKSENLTLIRTLALEIDSVILNDNKKLEFGTEPALVKVEVRTSGGGYNGESECLYLAGSSYTHFSQTFGKTHINIFDQYSSGDYTMAIMCEDSIGNKAFETPSFTITIDNDAPKVIRAFKEGGKLKIITNERAVCYYDYKKCNFDTEGLIPISIGFSTSHTIDWKPGVKYHIKCKDVFDKWDSRCSIIIKTEEI